ncbi:MAG: CHAT domain-containing protein, partial [Cyanobacteriota bacterium]|nr:CHAT domain-containing protein [Cyanobacteriota bacterium]
MNMPENLLKLKILDRSESSFHVSLTLLNSSSFEPVDAFLTAPPPELLAAFKNWHDTYCGLPIVRQWRLTPKSVSASGSCDQYKDEVKHFLNEWLNDSNVQWLRFREKLIYLSGQLRHSHQEASILLDAGENQLNHFPLQEWQFLREHFPNSEIGLRVKSEGEKEIQPPPLTQKIRVLILIGTTEGLNTSKDLEIVQRLEKQGAEVKVLVTPTSEELFKIFREDEGYDIFVFSGHSRSEEDKLGWIYINDNPEGCIQIDDFRNNFKCLIDKGLQLAIFNSCDGLGLAHQLAKLNLPRCIVMREPIPDPVAIRFIEEFFRNFTQNYPLFRSVNSAKISLEEFDQARKYPGAMWLPTLCVRQSALLQPFTWQSLKQSKSRTQTTSFIKDKKYLIAGILGCALIATTWGIIQGTKPVKVTEEACPKTLALASQNG